LFLIVVEGLAWAVREAESKGFLEVKKVGKRKIKISMLHFVADNMFVLRACNKNILVTSSLHLDKNLTMKRAELLEWERIGYNYLDMQLC